MDFIIVWEMLCEEEGGGHWQCSGDVVSSQASQI